MRAPVPPVTDIEKAQGTIRDLYKSDFAKTKAADRQALAAKLLQEALGTTNDPSAKFALLRESRDLSAKAGDAFGVLRAADEMSLSFAMKPGEAILPALDPLVGSTNTAANSKQIAEALVLAADEARFSGEWATSQTILKSASAAAGKTGASTTIERVRAKAKEAEVGRAESERAKEAFDTLKQKPTDAAACLVAGRFLAFIQQDWNEGLLLLARGSDERMQSLARRDEQAAKGGDEDKIAAADGWYDFAASADPAIKAGAQIRAYHWYVSGFGTQSGLNKTRIEKRIAELQPIADAKADRSEMWAALRRTADQDRLRKWRLLNNPTTDKAVEELAPSGGYLVGFHYTTAANKLPGVVQPIYMTPFGEAVGGSYGTAGKKDSARATVKAKPGYAIGGLSIRAGGTVEAVKPVFMRIVGKGLNKDDSYEGPMIGNTTQDLTLLGGDGAFIVGLHGRLNEKSGKFDALSPITLLDEKAKKKKK
ncbi:MAG: hypothetical protein U0791_24825 [Gemmataceae bacterium]